jgi:hypothetical protein
MLHFSFLKWLKEILHSSNYISCEISGNGKEGTCFETFLNCSNGNWKLIQNFLIDRIPLFVTVFKFACLIPSSFVTYWDRNGKTVMNSAKWKLVYSHTRFWINIYNIYQRVLNTKQWDDLRLADKVLSCMQMECGMTLVIMNKSWLVFHPNLSTTIHHMRYKVFTAVKI